MSINSLQAEDTQPFRGRGEDTQPVSPAPRRGRRGRGRRWPLLLIVAVTCCTLAVTSVLFIRSLPFDLPSRIGAERQVTINRDGFLHQVYSRAETIAELLNESEIAVPLDAWLSHELDGAIADGMTITIKAARDVRIEVGDEARVLRTALDNPLEILNSAGIAVSEADRIRVNGALAHRDALAGWTIPAEHIEVRRPFSLTVIDNGERSAILTTAETVGAVLAAAGIKLHPNDAINPPRDSAVSRDMTIVVERATPIALRLDGVLIEVRTRAQRVDEALQELNAPLFGLDYVIPSGETEIVTDMLIEIVRVTEEVSARQETIAYELRYVADAGLSLDQRVVAQAGQNGTREIRSLARYENGAEVSRSVTESVVTQPPQDQLIHYGTKIDLRTVETPGGPRLYWRVLCMLATSYHPAALGGDNVTAIGWTLEKGIVAADPKLIRYRSEVFVPGYGVAYMADTGGPRSSRYWIDLGYSDEDWVSWRRYVKVYLLTPVPPEIDYILPVWTPIRSVPGGCGN
ncbi:MAG: ubiquitin-like domain-containing protein [Chloroflexi bacterium]|nr:ubiquitin-like domain-containing protein [Chloroflexota bacterium]